MSSLQIAQTTLIIGLIGIFVPTASQSLLHKFGKQYSFVVVENDHYLIIKSNPWFNLLKSISIFFVCSLLTISVAGNKGGTVYLQLVAIYAVSFVLAFIGFFRRMKFAIIIDKKKQTLKRKNDTYSLEDLNEFEISEFNFWIETTYDSYGLYIKGHGKKRKFIYGYSVLTDIEQLKKQIEQRLIR